MPNNTVSDWSTTPASNTEVGGVDLAENSMRPRDVNNAIRTMMSQIATGIDNAEFGSAYFHPASASSAAYLDFAEDTDNGTNKISVIAPASIASDKTITWPDVTGTLLVGALGATDNALLRSDGTGGSTAQGSAATLTDAGYLTAVGLVARTTSAASVIFANEQSTGFNAEIAFQSGGTTKWEMGKDSVDNFFYYDNAAARNVMSIATGGDMVLMPAGGNVDSAGAIRSTGITGIGYKAGAGGTVTQLTNKATGVTLSKASGTITTHNAALAAATIVSFVLTNTSIAAGDVLVLNHVSGGTVGAYTLNSACGAGSATIYIRNNTAGSLSDAIVIGFALIKAVTA